jgi:hypothetical protein
MPDESPEHKAHMKIIDRGIKRRRSRRPAHVVDRIRVTDTAMADALRERMQAAGLDTRPRTEPRPLTDKHFRHVTLPVVKWWAVMVDEFAAQQGITPEKFMADILTEGLYEVYLEFMAQKNEAIRAARLAAAPEPKAGRTPRRPVRRSLGEGRRPVNDLDDDIPF